MTTPTPIIPAPDTTTFVVVPDIYKVVDVTPDDVVFWKDRFTDHTKFIYHLLDERRAYDINNQVDNVKLNLIRRYKKGASDRNTTWKNFVITPDYTVLLRMLLDLKKFKTEILISLSNNIDLGFIYRSLITHMMSELDYFTDLLKGKMTIDKEYRFWKQENSEHTAMSAHLMDPKLDQQTLDTLKLSQIVLLSDITNVIVNLQTSNDDATHFLTLMKVKHISLMDSEMLEHEIKETNHGIMRLTRILEGL